MGDLFDDEQLDITWNSDGSPFIQFQAFLVLSSDFMFLMLFVLAVAFRLIF